MRAHLAALLLVVIVLEACTPPQTTPSASPSPPASASAGATGSAGVAAVADMSAALLNARLPIADVFDLTHRLAGKSGTPDVAFQPVRTTPPDEGIGTSLPFWTYDFAAQKNVQITATLRIIGEHAKWWVQDGASVDLNALRQNADIFDTKTYPTDRSHYGSEWSPGIDGDPHIDVLVGRIPGAAAGYFSSADELPRWVNQYSAEREMVYLNALAARSTWNDIIAHEFCHMIQCGRRTRSAVWFDEGHAQLCEAVNGYSVSHVGTFLQLPDTQWNTWPQLEQSAASYGEAYLVLEFVRQQAGGDALVNAFIEHGIVTPADMDQVLRARGQRSLQDLYADLVAANAFIGSQTADAAYGYPDGAPARNPVTVADGDHAVLGKTYSGSVHQYAARYVELPRASMNVTFTGPTSTKLLPTDAHSGATMWWSDRADSLDSSLTRAVDLKGAKDASLSFWTWYDAEQDYDYAYVAASADGGQHWETLPATGTTTDDPNGANLGHGFTGTSGGGRVPNWVHVRADLSAYAGKQILLRFEYVTDQALNLDGFAIDDVEIPGVFSDDVEQDRGWQASGFVRSTNAVAQRFVVQILRFTAGGATVERHVVDDGRLQLNVDTSADRKPPLLAVTGFAVRTTQPVSFEVAVAKQ